MAVSTGRQIDQKNNINLTTTTNNKDNGYLLTTPM